MNGIVRCTKGVGRTSAGRRAIQTCVQARTNVRRASSALLSGPSQSDNLKPSPARFLLPTSSTSRSVRHISSTRTRLPSDPSGKCISTTFDDERPDLFYHLYDAPNAVSPDIPVYALSFMQESPLAPHSCAIIGWLPARAAGASEADAGLNDFVENELFREVLHDAIRSGLKDGIDEEQKNAAIQTQEGWMHLHDMRNVPALGRIGDPDDILGSVRVEQGEILAETYQPMPAYRLCTSDGILQLTEGLRLRLLEHLQARSATESSYDTGL